ncbi:PepSY-associated TM helix domain-containing protein [Phenylobacterium sp. SCN 70-31]|uniref:PepSY-associated TM helix domain-containing protein n=1 Tax=Phenylobacterium sp. SCN 70-31 TaxID=1660129 RepID=UPI00086CC0EF|nr:PepSY-associated TM helix domain-containing protein [Phenylobacterium sp. SCN 70-31]ODT88962.1 MAG: peptidase [Phenylobacterium sp. SCN 70-31]
MRLVDLLHRWTGGLIGLLLAVLGLSGAVLAHKDAWIGVPGVRDAQAQDTAALAAAAERLLADPETRPRSIVFATRDFGLDTLSYSDGGGGYARQDGTVVARWADKWERPEAWLFDLHHHLLSGDTGEIAAGVAGLAGLGFVVTGLILWWPLRRSFEFRAWPKRMARFPILRHHRDWGALLSPILAVSLITGTIMIFRPVADLVLGPGAAAEVTAAFKPPPPHKAALADAPDWAGMIATARELYPDAEVRILSLPRGDAGYVSLRMRQPREWLPNGRTTLWFAADTGELAHVRDALKLAPRAQAYNALYPVHAAKVGGLPYRLVITLCGLALGAFGTLTVWTFWFTRRTPKRRLAPA